PLREREDAGAEDLGEERALVERERDRGGPEARDRRVEEDRQREVDPDQLDRERHGAEQVDVELHERVDDPAAAEPADRADEPERDSAGHGDAGDLKGRLQAVEEKPPVVEYDMQLIGPVSSRSLLETRWREPSR